MEDGNSRNAQQVMSQSEDAAAARTATDSFQDDTVLGRKVVVLGVCAMRKKVSSIVMAFVNYFLFGLYLSLYIESKYCNCESNVHLF